MKSYDKCIIFDFDCTIGYFKQIVYLLNIVEKTYEISLLEQNKYFELFDSYPYMFRPKIYDIFNLILSNKENIKFFVLYTNNKNKDFVFLIIKYIQEKLKYNKKIFDYELFHNSSQKKLSNLKDYINTIGNSTFYCYIDDSKNINMSDKKLQYIHCEKYIYNYTIEEIINNFPFILFNKVTKTKLRKYFLKYFEKLKKTNDINQLPRSSFNLPSIKMINIIHNFILF